MKSDILVTWRSNVTSLGFWHLPWYNNPSFIPPGPEEICLPVFASICMSVYNFTSNSLSEAFLFACFRWWFARKNNKHEHHLFMTSPPNYWCWWNWASDHYCCTMQWHCHVTAVSFLESTVFLAGNDSLMNIIYNINVIITYDKLHVLALSLISFN